MAAVHKPTVKLVQMVRYLWLLAIHRQYSCCRWFVISGCCPFTDSEASADGSLFLAAGHSQTVSYYRCFVICGCYPLTDSEAVVDGSLFVAAVLSQTVKLL